jgi:hypothetical protein
MDGQALREFGLVCFGVPRATDNPIDKDSFRAIAEGLVRRANDVDRLNPAGGGGNRFSTLPQIYSALLFFPNGERKFDVFSSHDSSSRHHQGRVFDLWR